MRRMFLVLGMGFAGSFYAQTEITYGVKAGMNISSLSSVKGTYNNTVNYAFTDEGNAKGAYAGGFVNFSFNKYIGLQQELYFSMQGGKQFDHVYRYLFEDKGMLPIGYTKLRFYYIDLPVLFEFKPLNNFSILIGPSISYKIYNDADYSESNFNPDDYLWKYYGEETDKHYRFPKTSNIDFAVQFGLQYVFYKHLKLEVRYKQGVLPSFKNNLYDFIGISNYILVSPDFELKGWKNKTLQVGVGHVF